MNYSVEMFNWLVAQRELISSQQKRFFDLAVSGEISQEEAMRNIGELIIERRTLDRVEKKLNELDREADKEAEAELERIENEFAKKEGEGIPEDGDDNLRWDDMEEQFCNPVPDIFDEEGNQIT